MNSKFEVIGALLIGIVMGCSSILLYLYFEYREFSKNLTERDDSFQKYVIEINLFSIVRNIEFYGLMNGRYPHKLSEVRRSIDEIEMYIDPYANREKCIYEFYYFFHRATNKYWLLSPGKDRKLFTEDDILPGIERNKLSNLGLLFEKNTEIHYPELECPERDRT